jgi:DNA-binding LytR/AlgR family response regulator
MESVLRKIVINTPTRQCTFYGGLTAEEEKLSKYDFIRIHKGYLVNMAHIQRINKTNVVLKNGQVLPLSEHRFKTVFDSFTSYLARC